jgi:peptidoglycan hydrolase-like protein with peptidoglycan-binding domain
MSMPLLDRESYQLMSSEWVLYAGQLLQQQGYLSSEPTGTYDDELAAAVAAFQAANGIAEDDQIGPATWAALGAQDSSEPVSYDESWYQSAAGGYEQAPYDPAAGFDYQTDYYAAPAEGTATDAGTGSAETSDTEVEALDLQPKAKAIALKLKKKYPSISFTSGKREDVSDQARAMAGNVVSNRRWIMDTYKDQTLAKELQDWLDENPAATSKDAIADGLTEVMEAWDDKKRGRLSAHFSGEAFDIQPQTEQAAEIIGDAREWAEADGGKFLDKEGGLVRWHVQVRE